jgi:hypothetical protein
VKRALPDPGRHEKQDAEARVPVPRSPCICMRPFTKLDGGLALEAEIADSGFGGERVAIQDLLRRAGARCEDAGSRGVRASAWHHGT